MIDKRCQFGRACSSHLPNTDHRISYRGLRRSDESCVVHMECLQNTHNMLAHHAETECQVQAHHVSDNDAEVLHLTPRVKPCECCNTRISSCGCGGLSMRLHAAL